MPPERTPEHAAGDDSTEDTATTLLKLFADGAPPSGNAGLMLYVFNDDTGNWDRMRSGQEAELIRLLAEAANHGWIKGDRPGGAANAGFFTILRP